MTNRRDILKSAGPVSLALASGLTLDVGKAHSAENKKRIRLAVVGGGFGAYFYWHEHPNCEVVAVTDLREDRRKKLQEVYKCRTAYDSLEEMARKANNIDAVAVFSGALDHVPHALLCFEKGWHVISAVPACQSLEEAQSLKSAVKKSGLSYMLAETSYYRQSCIFARELHRKKAFGNLFYTEAEYYHDRGDLERLKNNKKSRFFNPDGTHSWRWGFPPMHYPTHSIGFLTGVTEERVTEVSCLGWGTSDHPYLTDNAYKNPFWNQASMMRTNKGNMFRCNVFWLCAAHGERAQWFGDKATLRMNSHDIHDSKLLFRTKGDTPTEYDLPVQEGGDVDIPVYWKTDMLPETMRHDSGHGGSHTFLAAEFINSLVDNRDPAIDVDSALAMTVPGIVAHQSSLKNGEQLKVPQFT